MTLEETLQNEQGRKIAVMQPYFFPYIGYFQLINAVDLFVVYDDGLMFEAGYIRRNSIMSHDHQGRQPIILPKNHSTSYRRINETDRADSKKDIRKILTTLKIVYSKAPYLAQVLPMIEDIFNYPERNLVKFLMYELQSVCRYIGITTRFALSSEVSKEGLEHVEEKVFRICDHFGIHDYINPIGGTEFYKKEYWAENGVLLSFIHRNEEICYQQFKEPFVKDLSIIDIMMFNSPEEIRKLLKQYTIV